MLIRDLDLPVPATDGRRLEVVVDGLPLFGGCQLAVDTALVCALHCDGSLHNGPADVDGVVLKGARRRKERTYPEVVGPRTRALLLPWRPGSTRKGTIKSGTKIAPQTGRTGVANGCGELSCLVQRPRLWPFPCWI